VTERSDQPKPSLPAVLTDEERRDSWIALTVSLLLPIFLGFVVPVYGLAFLIVFVPLALAILLPAVWIKSVLDWKLGDVSSLRALAGLLGRIRPLLVGVPTGEDLFRDGFTWKKIPWVTLSLIGINAALFYLLPADLTSEFAQQIGDFQLHQAVTSTFLHGSNSHLWGNMLFLWAFGGILEPRIGHIRMLGSYIACGLLSSAMTEFGYAWWMGQESLALGASGAIAGLMGLAMVRCYYARISVSVPIFGALGFVLPVGVQARIHLVALVVIYFMFDLLGARYIIVHGQQGGTGYWAHVGGYLGGIGIAYAMGLFREGLAEKQRTRALERRTNENLRGNRQDLVSWVQKNPDDLEAMLELARLESRPFKKPEGDELYRRVIRALRKTDFRRSAEIYLEYFAIYDGVFPPTEQVLLARELRRGGAIDDAVRSLEKSLKEHPPDDREHVAGRERALFMLGQLFKEIGLLEPAVDALRQLLYEFPNSEMRRSVERRLAEFGPVIRSRPGEVAS